MSSTPLRFAAHSACEALTATVTERALPPDAVRQPRRYRSGDTIWTAAALPDRVFRLKSGRVHIVLVDPSGQEYLARSVAPGELFGEMCFCSHRHLPHSSEARSLGPSEVWAISYREFRRGLAADVSLVDGVVQAFCTRVSDAERRAQMLTEKSASLRLMQCLLHLAESRPGGAGPAPVALTISHAQLAALSALSRPHVSMLMTAFRRRGLVAYKRGGPLRIVTEKLHRSLERGA